MLPPKRLVLVVRPSTKDTLPVITQDTTNESSLVTKEERHPHYGFVIKSELHRDVYDALFSKGYQCLTEYINSDTQINVVCPSGHEWHAHGRRLLIPCNNCRECWKITGTTAEQKIAQIIQARNGTQLSPYNGTKISIRCEEGHSFERPTASINQGTWCTECPALRVERGKIKFEKVLKEKGLVALSEFIGTTKLVHLKCTNGHTFWQPPIDLYRTEGCNHCRGRTKEAGELRFRKYVEDKGGVVTGQYINNCTKVGVICDKGHNFEIEPSNTCRGGWCSKCAGTCPKQAEEKFIRNVSLMNGTILGQYKNWETKVPIKCNFDHVFNMAPSNVNHGGWCSECQGHCPIAAERKFKEVVAKRGGTMIGQYVNSHTKIDVSCSKGHLFKVSQGNAVFNGLWCKVCGQSETHGERAVREYLEKKALKYDTEVTFGWYPKGRYDFSFNYKDRNFLVEFDGGQHFKYVYYFHRDEAKFNRCRQLDIDKSRAAMMNGHYLIRIADTDIFEVDSIIEGFIESDNTLDKLLVSDYEKYHWLLESLTLL